MSDSTPFNIQDFQNGMQWKEFVVAATLGLVYGVSVEVKFGHVPDAVATVVTDVWEGGAGIPVYIYPDNAGEKITIQSTLADTQPIKIIGLDINGDPQEKEGILNGVTPVDIDGDWTAINRAFNNTDEELDLLGTISIKGKISGNTFAIISADDQQTSQVIYKVPNGFFAIINNYSTAMNIGGNQDASVLMRLSAKEVGNVFRTQIRYGLQKRGTSNLSSDLVIPPVLPPLTKIKVSAEADSGPMDLSAEFSMLLIRADLLPNLQALFPAIFGGE